MLSTMQGPRLMPEGLVAVDFADLPGWDADDHAAAFEAFRRSAGHALEKPYRTGSLGLSSQACESAFRAAVMIDGADPARTKAFFETYFLPARLPSETGGAGFVTGFYEPVAEASPIETDAFRFPVYRPPDDLVAISDANRPTGMDPYLAFARREGELLREYHDRAAIEGGALAGRGLEIAWLRDRVDLFFIHVQGAARLVMPDGSVRRITYAAKSGQRFTGPGHVLAELGEIAREAVTMQTIRAWFAAHPDRMDDILHRNRSFIFWREASVEDADLGPIAAAKVPLTAGRSMAVDRLIHTFGTPFFIDVSGLTAFDGQPFRRLMIAQDTGSAIVGQARGDLFAGSGPAAGEIAGVVRSAADFYILWPRSNEDRS